MTTIVYFTVKELIDNIQSGVLTQMNHGAIHIDITCGTLSCGHAMGTFEMTTDNYELVSSTLAMMTTAKDIHGEPYLSRYARVTMFMPDDGCPIGIVVMNNADYITEFARALKELEEMV